jgi:dTDP-4-dehydrorhamnose 3,5-epimerase-like enzyme
VIMMLFNIRGNMNSKPIFIAGNIHCDQRGSISFINGFSMDLIKRFYLIEPANCNIIRAWQGHKNEQKWFHVVQGSFKTVAVRIDDWNNPSSELEVYEYDLNMNPAGVLHIPGGFANGFKANEPNSKLMIFSDFTLQQSVDDEYRFDQNKWFDWFTITK